MGYHESLTEGRNAVLEAFRSGKTVDRLFVLDGCQDGPVKTILREAKKQDTMVQYVKKERLDQLSETKNHQGVIAYCAACEYAEVSDILENAKKKGEAPFIVLLDGMVTDAVSPLHNHLEFIRVLTDIVTYHKEGGFYVVFVKQVALRQQRGGSEPPAAQDLHNLK